MSNTAYFKQSCLRVLQYIVKRPKLKYLNNQYELSQFMLPLDGNTGFCYKIVLYVHIVNYDVKN